MATQYEKQIITSHLFQYADDIDAKIVGARDFGSRARGLESESSDYDVRFVFTQRPADCALGVDSDSYDRTVHAENNGLSADIDLSGWSLSKFVGNDGLLGSNPGAIEFALSPEPYYLHTDDRVAEMCEHAVENFKPYALINHYRSMAASNYGKYIEGDYKLTGDTSWGDLIEYSDPDWHHLSEKMIEDTSVSEKDTTIGEDHIGVFIENTKTYPGGSIDIDKALDAGLVEPTTLDRTVKRYLAIVQSLMRARYVEETHEPPVPMDFTEFIREISGSDWLPEDVYAETGDLIARKISGESGEYFNETLNDWIESELGRDIDPSGHVERSPDPVRIYKEARELYNEMYA